MEAGSNQTWDEFRGYAYRGLPYQVPDESSGSGAGSYVPTCGSVLMLDMGTHVNIIEEFYSAGSIGNFTLQMQVEFENWSDGSCTRTSDNDNEFRLLRDRERHKQSIHCPAHQG